MKIKNLIIFFPIFNRGGLEEVSNLILKYLKKTQINIYLITFKKNKYLFGKYKNVKILCPKNLDKQNSNFKKLFLCCIVLIKLLKKKHPKNTIVFSLQNSAVSILISKIFKFKIMIKNATPIQALFYLNNKFNALIIFLIKILSYNFADKIIVNSISNKNSLSKFIFNKKKILVIYNPVNFIKNNIRNKNRKRIILSVGRLVYEKGIHILIKAFEKLKRNDYRLVIIGDGIYKKKLEKLVLSLNLKKKVIFKGWIKQPMKFYNQAEIFVLPSFFEGFGNSLVEAMYYQTSCIATSKSGGPSEILGYGKYGSLIKNNDIEDLKKKMEFHIKYPNKIKKKVLLAKKSLHRFKTDNLIKKYIKELNNIL